MGRVRTTSYVEYGLSPVGQLFWGEMGTLSNTTPLSPSLISLKVSVNVKHHVYLLTVTNPELRRCGEKKVEAAVLGSPSLI